MIGSVKVTNYGKYDTFLRWFLPPFIISLATYDLITFISIKHGEYISIGSFVILGLFVCLSNMALSKFFLTTCISIIKNSPTKNYEKHLAILLGFVFSGLIFILNPTTYQMLITFSEFFIPMSFLFGVGGLFFGLTFLFSFNDNVIYNSFLFELLFYLV